ncbi:type I restriction endonuclease [Halostreptopolyspora alba]|uniref:type I restriction endonuclease n=1 Tax=Halostreptopolyspora alba TaxID=2487137 RepID=UPI00371B06D4
MTIATAPRSADARQENRTAHSHLTGGVRFTHADEYGAEHSPTMRLADFHSPGANTFRAVSQVRLLDGDRERRFDVVLYVNGLPLAAVELKNASDEREVLSLADRFRESATRNFALASRERQRRTRRRERRKPNQNNRNEPPSRIERNPERLSRRRADPERGCRAHTRPSSIRILPGNDSL